jgi:periplasmic divalent cation tolerance protein
MENFSSVFVTSATQEEAEKIALTMIEEKLTACANIMPRVKSIYRWQRKIEKSDECVLILKIKSENFDALQKRINDIHSYECSCIVAWPIVASGPDFLKWLGDAHS